MELLPEKFLKEFSVRWRERGWVGSLCFEVRSLLGVELIDYVGMLLDYVGILLDYMEMLLDYVGTLHVMLPPFPLCLLG